MAQVLIPILDPGTRRLAAGQLPISEVGEIARDAIGSALSVSGAGSVTVSDAGDTIVVNITATANSSDAQLRDRSTHTGTQSSTTISDLAEAVQDIVGAMVTSGGGITWTYNDSTGKLEGTATGGGADLEAMRDAMGVALVGINGVTIAVNDAADTITLGVTGLTIAQVTGLQTALDGKVSLTADQTVNGLKTFNTAPIVPTPTEAGQASNKGYVDSAIETAIAAGINADVTTEAMTAALLADGRNLQSQFINASAASDTLTRDLFATILGFIRMPDVGKLIFNRDFTSSNYTTQSRPFGTDTTKVIIRWRATDGNLNIPTNYIAGNDEIDRVPQ